MACRLIKMVLHLYLSLNLLSKLAPKVIIEVSNPEGAEFPQFL